MYGTIADWRAYATARGNSAPSSASDGDATDSTETYLLKSTVDPAAGSLIMASSIMTKTHANGVAVANDEQAIEIKAGDTVKTDGGKATAQIIRRMPRAGVCVLWKNVERG